MAAKPFTVKIDSVLGGLAPTTHFASAGQFRAMMGIDPAQPIDDADTVYSTIGSGILRPAASQKLSGSTLAAAPLWMVPNPKDANVYVYDARGSAYTIDAAMSTFTAIADGGSLSNAKGNGCEYYDNYIYFGKNTTVARYGPLNGVPAFTADFWVNYLSKAQLTDTQYPVSRKNNIQYPNRIFKRHSNGKLYFTDVVGNQGTLHSIQTTKTTVEGDTANADDSVFSALTFGYGLWPTALESHNEGLVIALYEGSGASSRQPRAKIGIWDDTSTNVNKIIWCEYPDTYISAIKNVGGTIYVFSGNINAQGYRVTIYLGGYSFREIYYSETGEPPLPGAVDGILQRVIFGTYTTIPESDGVAYSVGLQKEALGNGVFGIMRSTGANASTCVTAVLVADNNEMGFMSPIIGWTQAGEGSTGVSHGIDKQGTEYNNAPSVFWSELFRIGKHFKITKIRIPFAQAVAANMILTAKIYVDDGIDSKTMTTINNTNYPNGERFVTLKPDGFDGYNNFWLELKWTGSALLTVGLPIIIEGELIDEQ